MTKMAYKLFRELKSGEITSLFINKSRRLPFDEILDAECFPTKGFAERAFWHCTDQPHATHLKMELKSGEKRVWRKVLMHDYEEFQRPDNQGGMWYLAKRIIILSDVMIKVIDNHKKYVEEFVTKDD